MGGGHAGTAPLALSADPRSVRAARRHVAAALCESGHPSWVDAAQLAVSEIVTNAVLHARTRCEVSVDVQDTGVRVSVRDFSPSMPLQRHFGADATTGRGLSVVARVTAAHGVTALGAAGKVVWFAVDDTVDGAADADGPGAGDWGLGDPEDPEDGLVVLLPGLPTALWSAALEHQAAVLRELYLVQVSGGEGPSLGDVDLTAAATALRLLSEGTGLALAAAAAHPDLTVSRQPAGPDRAATLDVPVRVAGTATAVFGHFQDALDLGRRLALEGRLLLSAPLPEVVSLRDWACDQVVAQANGAPPVPWDEAHLLSVSLTGRTPPSWDDRAVSASTRAVVAADDTNRIIAVSAAGAALLGATPDQLIGQRITTIMPARLREQHVAGFTRHLTTGQVRVLGVELDLPVLRRDGTEVLHRVLIEQVPAPVGRQVFVAWMGALVAPCGGASTGAGSA